MSDNERERAEKLAEILQRTDTKTIVYPPAMSRGFLLKSLSGNVDFIFF